MLNFAAFPVKLLRQHLLIPTVLLASAWQAQAVHWTLSQAGPPTWTYTLQFDPEDNYSIYQSSTTITMSGLYGVTAAGAPTSTDFPNPAINTLNLAWTPQVLNNGTTVVWTHVGGGTGNFPTTQHVFGFSITAAGAQNGTVSYATSGMSRDAGSIPEGGTPPAGASLDISGTIAGPSATGGTVTTVPAASPLTITLTCVALALAGGYQLRNRIHGGFQS
jgi:hypothetical protein